MALRLIETFEGPPGLNNQAKVYFNVDYNEYQVKLFHDGKHVVDADCFDDDREAALDTAQAMVKVPQSPAEPGS